MDSSYLKVHYSVLIKKCCAIIQQIEAARAKEDAEFIKNEIICRNYFRKFFFLKPLTEEDIKKRYTEDAKSGRWCPYPSIYAWGDLGTAKTLLKAADAALDGHAEEFLCVTVNDWATLNR